MDLKMQGLNSKKSIRLIRVWGSNMRIVKGLSSRERMFDVRWNVKKIEEKEEGGGGY